MTPLRRVRGTGIIGQRIALFSVLQRYPNVKAEVQVIGSGFSLKASQCAKTVSAQQHGHRLQLLEAAILEALDKKGGVSPELVSVERIFHNRNVSSSLQVAHVVGLIHLASYKAGVPIIEVTPQEVKSACGLGARANKAAVKTAMSRLLKTELKNSHIADAAAAALAGALQVKSRRNK